MYTTTIYAQRGRKLCLSLYKYTGLAIFSIKSRMRTLFLCICPSGIVDNTMERQRNWCARMCFLVILGVCLTSVVATPASFSDEFTVTSEVDHVKTMADNNTIELILDQNSGAGFASKYQYMFGLVSMEIKLVSGDSAGTVTAFYMNSDGDKRDELDFEFLGNRSGQPYTVQTNIYALGKGDREQRVNLWFDPSLEFHKYSIFWNHYHILFSVDDIPIRVYKNNEAIGIPFPGSQSMGIFSSLWDADSWATRGGLEKIDWSKAPFVASYRDFEIDSCQFPGNTSCAPNTNNWWEGLSYRNLSSNQARLYKWVRTNYMIYDYCTDRSRYPVPPIECTTGI